MEGEDKSAELKRHPRRGMIYSFNLSPSPFRKVRLTWAAKLNSII